MNNENEAPELLPCPFCGSSKVDPEGWYRMTEHVFGPGCVVFGPACDECGSSAKTIAAWNTRADLSDDKDKRIEELEDQLKMVLDRESATHLRHDAKTDKLEALIAELEAKLARVIEVLELIAGRGVK